MKTTTEAKAIAEEIRGYAYGTAQAAKSPITLVELEHLKQSAGFTLRDEKYLRMAGDVLADQTEELVNTWRGAVSKVPHLAKHSRGPDGKPLTHYSEASGLRFQQWILDTCLRPYDQDWLNYQHEIALRHTGVKKNTTDGVQSTPYIPLRDVIAFTAVINETVKPFLAAKGHPAEEVERMHSAWCKSIQMQIALWAEPYVNHGSARGQW